MDKKLIPHIQTKIKSLKNEINAIQYTINIDEITNEKDFMRIQECIHKIQVLNEILITFGIQKCR
jgi:hypothetical protein